MKKTFYWNEKGSVLPLVLVISSLIVVSFISSVNLFIKNIEEKQFIVEQIEVETLFQMSKHDIKNIIDNKEVLDSELEFNYPNGNVYIKVIQNSEFIYTIKNEFELANNSSYYFDYQLNNKLEVP